MVADKADSGHEIRRRVNELLWAIQIMFPSNTTRQKIKKRVK